MCVRPVYGGVIVTACVVYFFVIVYCYAGVATCATTVHFKHGERGGKRATGPAVATIIIYRGRTSGLRGLLRSLAARDHLPSGVVIISSRSSSSAVSVTAGFTGVRNFVRICHSSRQNGGTNVVATIQQIAASCVLFASNSYIVPGGRLRVYRTCLTARGYSVLVKNMHPVIRGAL